MILNAPISSQYSFEELCKRLAFESVDSASTVMSIFSSLIPKAANAIQSIANTLSLKPEAQQETKIRSSQYRKIIDASKSLPYISYRDMVIMVPEGFHGNLANYLKFITQLRVNAIARAETVLNDYHTQLAIFLNNVNSRTSVESYSVQTKKLEKERLDIERDLAGFFSNAAVHSRTKFGSVVSRFSELHDIFAFAEQIERYKTNSDLSKLIRLTEQVNDLFKLLKDKLDKNEIDIISGQAAKNVSEGAFQAAKFLEVASIVVYNTEVMGSVIASLADQLEKAIVAK